MNKLLTRTFLQAARRPNAQASTWRGSTYDQYRRCLHSGTSSSTHRARSATSSAIFFGVPVAVTFSLGVWQLKRLERKRGMITARNESMALEPIPLDIDINTTNSIGDHRRVKLSGEFMHDQEILVGPRSAPASIPPGALQWGGSSGFLVVTPFRTTKGDVTMVLRGWIPVRLRDAQARRKAAVDLTDFLLPAAPPINNSDSKSITGVLRRVDEKNR